MGPRLRLCALALLPLILPAADFTTYIGDTHDYRVVRVIAGPAGSTYVGGTRDSGMFAMKLDAAGRIVLYATLNGKGADQVNDMAVDAAGNIYLAGSTNSPLLPLRNALQATPGPGFAVKLSPDATQIIFATYFPEAIRAMAIDASGNLYVTGSTYSSDFPVTPGLPAGTVTPPVTINITSAAFLTKIAASGDRIVYSTRISGHQKNCGAGSSCFLSSRTTVGTAVAVDSEGNAYLAGNTDTYDLPTTAGVLLAQGTGAFVAKVNAAGTALVYLTYIGAGYHPVTPFTNPANTVSAIAADAAGNAYLAGSTFDAAFPATSGAWQTTLAGGTDAFAAKLNPDGTAMIWASYLGGNDNDAAGAIALDGAGRVWLSGTTASADFPNSQGWSSGGEFIAGLTPTGAALAYSSRLPDDTVSAGLSAGADGTLHLAGFGGLVSTLSPDAPSVPRIFGIANAAYGPIGGRVSPGEVISIYGPHLGPSTPVTAVPDSAGAMPRTLGGVQVLFDGAPLALLYVSDSQINAVAPLRFITAAPRLAVVRDAVQTADFGATLIDADPQIFQTPDGVAAAVNQDGSINSPEHPAPAGSIVAIWATGVGSPPFSLWEDGRVAAEAATFGCCRIVADGPANIVYSGAAPGIVAGVVQVNFLVTTQLAAQGVWVPVSLAAGDAISHAVRLYVRAPPD